MPGDCSPSRSVVSKISTRSAMSSPSSSYPVHSPCGSRLSAAATRYPPSGGGEGEVAGRCEGRHRPTRLHGQDDLAYVAALVDEAVGVGRRARAGTPWRRPAAACRPPPIAAAAGCTRRAIPCSSQSFSMLRPITERELLIIAIGVEARRGRERPQRRRDVAASPPGPPELPKQTSRPPGRSSLQPLRMLRAADAVEHEVQRAAWRRRSGGPPWRSPASGSRSGGRRRSRGSRRACYGRGGAVDLGPDELRDLGRGDADAPGCGMDQHSLARLQRAVADEPAYAVA